MSDIVLKKVTADVLRKNLSAASYAAQFDKASRYLLVTFTADGEPIELESGALIKVNYRRPKLSTNEELSGYQQSFDGIVEEGKAKVPLPYWAVERSGLLTVSVSAYWTTADGESARLSTLSFPIEVEPAPYEEE